MKKIAILSLFLLLFACAKKAVEEAEEQIEVYTVSSFDSNVSAEKDIGGKKSVSWKGLSQGLIDKKEKSPKYLTLQMVTFSEEGFLREFIGIHLPIKVGSYVMNSSLSFKEPFAGYGIWGSDGDLLEASYDCDTIKSSVKVNVIDTVANVMSGEFELYFNTFNPKNAFPKITNFKKGKFDVKIKRY